MAQVWAGALALAGTESAAAAHSVAQSGLAWEDLRGAAAQAWGWALVQG